MFFSSLGTFRRPYFSVAIEGNPNQEAWQAAGIHGLRSYLNDKDCFVSGSEKGVFWKRGLFRKVQCRPSEEFRDSRDSGEPQTVENKDESNHFLEIREHLEVLEILEIPPVKRPLL